MTVDEVANGLSVERHGLERLRWLMQPWVWPQGVTGPPDYLKYQHLGAERTQIECAAAVIEELHDALAFWSSPQIVSK